MYVNLWELLAALFRKNCPSVCLSSSRISRRGGDTAWWDSLRSKSTPAAMDSCIEATTKFGSRYLHLDQIEPREKRDG